MNKNLLLLAAVVLFIILLIMQSDVIANTLNELLIYGLVFVFIGFMLPSAIKSFN